MADASIKNANAAQQMSWLKTYYFARFAVAFVWVAAALTIGKSMPWVGEVLLFIYPAWDAIANIADVHGNGGMSKNPTQALNAVISGVSALAVAIALGISLNAMLGVYGVWGALSGLLQLSTGVRRWKSYGAQWAMILSGAQSALAGAFFLKQASLAESPGISDIAPYAAFGAFYFLVSGLWLAVSNARSRRAQSVEA